MKCLENFAAPAAAAIVIVAFPAFCALAENLIPDGARNWANVARRDGGVICTCPRQVTFEDCLFAGNEAKNACGVGMTFHGTIRRSRLVGNCGAGSYGGTLDLRSGGALELFGGKPKFDVVDMGCYESPHRGLNGIVLRVD